MWLAVWHSGSGVCCMNKVTLCLAQLVLGWWPSWGGYTTSACNQPTKSTQPCIPLVSLNGAPALIHWGKGGNVTSAGWQVTLCVPIWHVSSHSSKANCYKLLCSVSLPFTCWGSLGEGECQRLPVRVVFWLLRCCLNVEKLCESRLVLSSEFQTAGAHRRKTWAKSKLHLKNSKKISRN